MSINSSENLLVQQNLKFGWLKILTTVLRLLRQLELWARKQISNLVLNLRNNRWMVADASVASQFVEIRWFTFRKVSSNKSFLGNKSSLSFISGDKNIKIVREFSNERLLMTIYADEMIAQRFFNVNVGFDLSGNKTLLWYETSRATVNITIWIDKEILRDMNLLWMKLFCNLKRWHLET